MDDGEPAGVAAAITPSAPCCTLKHFRTNLLPPSFRLLPENCTQMVRKAETHTPTLGAELFSLVFQIILL